MSPQDIAKGVREGWLVPGEDGWHRFVWDFEAKLTPTGTVQWIRKPSTTNKRVRVLS